MKYIKVKNFFVLLLSLVVFFSIGLSMIAHADDDDDEDRYEQHEDDDEDDSEDTQPVPVQEDVKVDTPKTVTKTIVDPPTTVVTYQTKMIEYPDTDQDGLIDAEDPHPTIAEIYFVKDDNFNGIVDTFEYRNDDDSNGVVDDLENISAS